VKKVVLFHHHQSSSVAQSDSELVETVVAWMGSEVLVMMFPFPETLTALW